MNAKVRYENGMRFIGTNEHGNETAFDTTTSGGGSGSAGSPMDVVLEAAAACSSMDVILVLQKKRRTIGALTIDLSAERADDYPKVFTSIDMHFVLRSSDATLKELAHAIELSQEKYCSVSIMLTRSGCRINWTAALATPDGEIREFVTNDEYRKTLSGHQPL